jgi:hypothetical protein
MLTLTQIEAEVRTRAKIVGASDSQLPTFGYTEDFARPHIEVDSRGYHYVVVERGTEWERFTTQSLDELLYTIFEHVVSGLSLDYELERRVKGQDCRKLAFRRQVELLSALSPEWASRRLKEQTRILSEHPFNDAPNERAT